MIVLLTLLLQAADAEDNFRVWQMQVLEKRAEPTNELRRILSRKIAVPEPGPKADLTPVRLDFGSMDPLGFLPAPPTIATRIGEPLLKIKSEATAQLAKLYSFEIRNLHYVSTDDGSAAFMTSEALQGPATPAGKFLFGVSTTGFALDGPKVGVEISRFGLSGEMSMSADSTFEVAGKVGPRIKLMGGALDVGAQVTAELSAPVVVDDVQWRSRWGASQVASGATEKIAELLGGIVPCVYCSAKGTVECRRCGDRKIVDCSDCQGHGRFSCEKERPCGSCKGSGQGRCGGCAGSGRQTVWDAITVEEPRTWLEPYDAGIDANGKAIVKYRKVTTYATVAKTVSRSVDCAACGGSKVGGSCGACGGRAMVTCGRCWGSGQVDCGECEAGRKTCRACSPNGFACPICRGRGKIGG